MGKRRNVEVPAQRIQELADHCDAREAMTKRSRFEGGGEVGSTPRLISTLCDLRGPCQFDSQHPASRAAPAAGGAEPEGLGDANMAGTSSLGIEQRLQLLATVSGGRQS